MTYITDQKQRSDQDVTAITLKAQGEGDGFEGIYPQHIDAEYLTGYVSGVWEFSEHIGAQRRLLQQEVEHVEIVCTEF